MIRISHLITLTMLVIIATFYSACSVRASRSTMVQESGNYQPKWTAQPGYALVYVIRPSKFGAANVDNFDVTLTDKNAGQTYQIGTTFNMEYICFIAQPGTYTLTSKADNLAELELSLADNTMYYVHQKPKMGMKKAANKLLPIDDVEGKYYMKKIDEAVQNGETQLAWIDSVGGWEQIRDSRALCKCKNTNVQFSQAEP